MLDNSFCHSCLTADNDCVEIMNDVDDLGFRQTFLTRHFEIIMVDQSLDTFLADRVKDDYFMLAHINSPGRLLMLCRNSFYCAVCLGYLPVHLKLQACLSGT